MFWNENENLNINEIHSIYVCPPPDRDGGC